MYGLYLGRELFPDGVVYFSQDTHYSVVKILSVLKARNIMIRSQDHGEIDYDDLYETIRINRDAPVVFVANIGTTMKGAVDDVAKVRAILDDLAITQSYLHADAALSGMTRPSCGISAAVRCPGHVHTGRRSRPSCGISAAGSRTVEGSCACSDDRRHPMPWRL